MKLRDRKRQDVPDDTSAYEVKIREYQQASSVTRDEYYRAYEVTVRHTSDSGRTRVYLKNDLTVLWWAKHKAKKGIRLHKKQLREGTVENPEPLELVYYRN